MTLTSLLNDATQENTPSTPELASAPQTQEEINTVRQQEENKKKQNALNRMRIEQLTASIFARLVSSPEILEGLTITDKALNKEKLDKFFKTCNVLSVEAALAHARGVWGLDCHRDTS